MARPILPDSNFYINCARRDLDPFLELDRFGEDWEPVTCGMVELEVLRGRSNPRVYQRFKERFALMIHLQSTQAVWEQAIQIAWNLDRRGLVIPAQDVLIATCALAHDAAVLTQDEHFRVVPGLAVFSDLATESR